jgi:glutamine amidotransferase
MIKIVDYGLGNIKAFYNLYKSMNIDIQIAKNADQLKNADKIILPGVGSFDQAMSKLNQSGMRDTLDELVLEKKIPVLGVCVGMQIMLQKSEEGVENGLGWIQSDVIKFDSDFKGSENKTPHMGWNSINLMIDSPLLKNLNSHSEFYFLHSYYCDIKNSENILATSNYQKEFTSILQFNNIYGIQCHPEKSHSSGINLLTNFSNI